MAIREFRKEPGKQQEKRVVDRLTCRLSRSMSVCDVILTDTSLAVIRNSLAPLWNRLGSTD
jgi:hypothetical protein